MFLAAFETLLRNAFAYKLIAELSHRRKSMEAAQKARSMRYALFVLIGESRDNNRYHRNE